MDRANPLYETARALLIDKFALPEEAVRPDTTFEEMDVDSLALAEFAFVLQDEFGVLLGEGDATRQSTLTDITCRLRARIEQAPEPSAAP